MLSTCTSYFVGHISILCCVNAINRLAKITAHMLSVFTARCYAEGSYEIACRLSISPPILGTVLSHRLEFFKNNFTAK